MADSSYTVFVYNNGNFENYSLTGIDYMPYSSTYLTVSEFKGSSVSNILWTSKDAMVKFAAVRNAYGGPVPVGSAFSRVWEFKHGSQSQHYAGIAFDCGQNSKGWNNDKRAQLRRAATETGLCGYIEPSSDTPTWVHIDFRTKGTSGFPIVDYGDTNVYILILQDCLNYLGYYTADLTGVFDINTKNAVINFQKKCSLKEDGLVGSKTWGNLIENVK